MAAGAPRAASRQLQSGRPVELKNGFESLLIPNCRRIVSASMPRRIEDSDDEAPAESSIGNADEAASLGDMASGGCSKSPTPAEKARNKRNKRPPTQQTGLTSDEGALVACLP